MNVLKIYNETQWTLLNLNDDIFKVRHKKIVENYKPVDKEEKERISLSRTKRRIKEICLCNDFEYFATMTVNSKQADRFSLQEVQDKMKKICKKIKRKNKEFKYIYITEKHENGAFHFHGLVKGIDLYKNDNGYYSNTDFDTLGYNSFSIIDDYNKCCTYISKYITKDCVRNENNQVYFCSRGMNNPQQEFMINTDLKLIFDDVYESQYCQKKDFNISRLSEKQKLKLNYYFKENDEFFEKNNNYITNWLQLFTRFNNYDNIKIRK